MRMQGKKKKKSTQSSLRPCYLNNGRKKKRSILSGSSQNTNQILIETAIGTVKKRDIGFETVQL